MNRFAAFVVAMLLGVIIGYFAGREHLKYEMRTAFESAAEELSEGLSSAFGGDSGQNRVSAEPGEDRREDSERRLEAAESAYIDEYVELYDLSARYIDTYSNDNVPGVQFKLRNNGERTLDRVRVVIYFKDAAGGIITEEDFLPVAAGVAFSDNNTPLRPGYIWQMESGRYYTAERVPSEWSEGSVEAAITEIEFGE